MALSPLGIALMQQQPIMPAHPGQVAPTNVLGAYQLSGQMAEQQYQAQLQQQLGLWGGLAGLGGAGIIGASKIPAIQNAVSNWISPGSAGSSTAPIDLGYANYNNGVMTGITGVGPTAAGASGTDLSGGASLGDWMSDPAFASLLPSSMTGAAADAGTGAAAGAAADAGAGAGSVAADLAAAAPAAAAGTDAAATGAFSLADLLPFLFAA